MPSVEIHRIHAVETYDLRAVCFVAGASRQPSSPMMTCRGRGTSAPITRTRWLGVASFYPRPCPCATAVDAVQLRFMAVDPAMQGRGVGRDLLDQAIRGLRQQRVRLLWANGRDTALGFYRRAGFVIVGEGFIHEPGLPHHLVTFDLRRELTPRA